VSPLATQLQNTENQHEKFVSEMLTQIAWTNHLEIFSAIKDSGQRLFCLLMSIKEKWIKIELRRQIKTASFERTMLANPIVTAVRTQLPQNLFKDPYIFEFPDFPDGHSESGLEKILILKYSQLRPIRKCGEKYLYVEKHCLNTVNRQNQKLLFFFVY
jgi:predicted nuclease of restriction endonuclease-like (RecB) superfamily